MAQAPSAHNLRHLPLEAASFTLQMQGGRSVCKQRASGLGAESPRQGDYSADQARVPAASKRHSLVLAA